MQCLSTDSRFTDSRFTDSRFTDSRFTDSRFEVRRHSVSFPWSYRQLDARQRELAELVREKGSQTFLLSEVAPVITYGRRTPSSDILLPSLDTTLSRIETYATDRGGYATYHGPGQWVLFPVGSLERLVGDSRGIQKMIQCLLEIALQVGLRYDSTAHIRAGCELGVWTSRGKFAAAGIHVEQGVVLHGLSINGFRTPESFQGLRPCGLDAPVDFLLKDQVADSATESVLQAEFDLLGQHILKAASDFFWQGNI
jgi:lipoate-protein ligase B